MVAAETVQKAKSGHPGAPMGCAPIAAALYGKVMKYSAQDSKWINRDRFVLSNGHASALLYTMLHLTGRITMEDLKTFRQLGSITPGHPELGVTPGVEVTSGPLGQGLCNAIGMAIAAKQSGARFNKPDFTVIDPTIFVLCGDGCLMEGVSNEASSLAGHLKLDNIIALYDDNSITIDGRTDVAFTEDVGARYEALGWKVLTVSNGDDAAATDIVKAIEEARTATQPVLIKVRTTIGLYSANADTSKVHGSPIGDADCQKVRADLGLAGDAFTITDDVKAYWGDVCIAKEAAHTEWTALMEKYAAKYPAEAAQLTARAADAIPKELIDALLATPLGDAQATRKAGNIILNTVADTLPGLIGGSADLQASNLTKINVDGEYFTPENHTGRAIAFGVREHGMAAIANGISAFGLHTPFVATFMVFAGYMLGSIRLSALSHHRVAYILTHDSIGVGEDGPTHQPVETLSQLRAMPNLSVWRPADQREVAAAYACMFNAHGPLALALSRQGCPPVCPDVNLAMKGGYTLIDEASPAVILVASGTEVSLAMDVAKALPHPVKVVSMPSIDVFNAQPIAFQESVLPRRDPTVPIVSIEAAAGQGMVGVVSHAHIGVEEFGRSAPGPKVYEALGLTVEKVSEKVSAFVGRKVGPVLF